MAERAVTVTFAGSGDAFGSGGRYQACIHVRHEGQAPFLVDCGATSLAALKAAGLEPGEIGIGLAYDAPVPGGSKPVCTYTTDFGARH